MCRLALASLLLQRCAAAITPPAWTIVVDWNAVSSGAFSNQASLAACAASAAGAAQFSFNLRSGHCFTSNITTFGGVASKHVTSGCIVARVADCGPPPPPPPPVLRTRDFPPGWNELARTPPMGWRSWNTVGATVTQHDIEATIQLITSTTAFGQPDGESLASLGYAGVGIDEGWEGCGEGVDGTQHDAEGAPVIHSRSFPDTAALVRLAHSRGLTIGWYQNGCACGELREETKNYEGDVRTALELGFDGVKFDGCGAQNNHTRYARLFNATGKAFLVEDCHAGDCTTDDNSGCATRDWCPFNMFRVSRDIDNTDTRWFMNLQSAVRFLDRALPVSQPGCWAYGDMMEVGRLSSYELSRAHFSAWSIMSSPLVLGIDLRQTAAVGAVWPILANKEVISINQAWAGHPGYRAKQWDPWGAVPPPPPPSTLYATLLQRTPCNASDKSHSQWSYDAAAHAVRFNALCLDSVRPGHLTLLRCDAARPTQRFNCSASAGQPCLLQQAGRCVTAQDWNAPNCFMGPCDGMGAQSAQLYTFGHDGLLSSLHADFWRIGTVQRCIGASTTPTYPDPFGKPERHADAAQPLQLWVKPQPRGAVAILILNMLRGVTVDVSVNFTADLNLSTTSRSVYVIRDVWTHADVGVAGFINVSVAGYDSKMYLLSPPADEMDR